MATSQAVHQLMNLSIRDAIATTTSSEKNGRALLGSSSFQGSRVGLRGGWNSRSGSCKASASARVCRAAAVSVEPTSLPKPARGAYEITTFTTWLLKQEQAGVIDGELTIVLSSIALACKQIASLVQRAGISNLTGLQGAANIQGEDQKKLDVISNEVNSISSPKSRTFLSRLSLQRLHCKSSRLPVPVIEIEEAEYRGFQS